MDRLGVRIAIEDELHKTGDVSYNDYAGLCGIAMFRAAIGYRLVQLRGGNKKPSV